MKIDPYLTLYIEVNPKWIKNLNVRHGTSNLIVEKAVNLFELIGMGKNFLNKTCYIGYSSNAVIKHHDQGNL